MCIRDSRTSDRREAPRSVHAFPRRSALVRRHGLGNNLLQAQVRLPLVVWHMELYMIEACTFWPTSATKEPKRCLHLRPEWYVSTTPWGEKTGAKTRHFSIRTFPPPSSFYSPLKQGSFGEVGCSCIASFSRDQCTGVDPTQPDP